MRSPEMVGRDEELAALLQLAGDAERGIPRVVLVEGEAGVGKTRLVRELTQRVLTTDEKTVIATGNAVELAGGSMPYGVAGSLMQELVNELGPRSVRQVLGDRAHQLGPLAPALGAEASVDRPSIDRFDLFSAARDLIAWAASDHRLVLVVEDLHWADASSLDLIAFLARSLTRGHLLMVATSRPEADESEAAAGHAQLQLLSGARTLFLGPLAEAHTRTLIELLAEGPFYPDAVERVASMSDGIPLYVEELVAATHRADSSPVVPRSLDIAFRSRMARLPEDVRHAVGLTSLAQRPVSGGDLGAVARVGAAQARELLDPAVTARLLEVDDSGHYRFRHALLRQSVRDNLAAAARIEGHKAWAEYLQRQVRQRSSMELLAATAHHWEAAGEPVLAFGAAKTAARAAEQVGAALGAGEHWQTALRLAAALEVPIPASERDDLLLHCVARYRDASAFARQRDVARDERASCEPNDKVRLLWADLTESEALFRAGEHPSLNVTREFVSGQLPVLTDSAPSALLLEVLLRLVELHPNAEIDRPVLHRIFDLIESTAADVPSAQEQGQEFRRRELLAWARGDVEEMVALCEAKLRLPGELTRADLAWAESDLVWALVSLGRFEQAIDVGEAVIRRTGLPSPDLAPPHWLRTAWVLGNAYYSRGDYRRTEELARHLVTFPPSLEAAQSVALLGILHVDRGEWDAALTAAQQVRDMLPALTTGQTSPAWHGAPLLLEARVALGRGDPHLARDLLEPLLQGELSRDPQATAIYVSTAAHIAAALRPPDPAWTRLVREKNWALPDLGADVEQMRCDVEAYLAMADGRPDPELWHVAVETAERVGWEIDVARLRLRYAECLLAAGRREAAADQLTHSQEVADRLGARPLLAQIEDVAVRARLAPSGRASSSHHAGLTQRERDVLDLLALGKTNHEVATALYMSPKTASVHVSRIIAKLGVTNRTEAATLAIRLGLSRSPTPMGSTPTATAQALR